jgi:ribosomal-protein-alanine N-acetyltransferase
MQSTDLPSVIEIENNVFSEPWTKSFFEDVMFRSETYVMYGENDLLGYIVMIMEKDIAYIANFAIQKVFWNCGYGGQLLMFIILQAKRLACSVVYLDVRASNHRAIKLYQKFGFFEFQRIGNYYTTPPEDAIQMALRIGK